MEDEYEKFPGPDEFNHVEDYTSEDDSEVDDEPLTEDDACEPRGGCMPDPEDFDD
jgi:hypothetical protein